jgi:hypothetical protein
VRVGEQTLSVSPTLAPRLTGLFERATVYAPEVLVEASLPVAASAVTALEWSIDDGEPRAISLSTGIAGTGPQAGSTSWSLGGADGAGNSKPLSLSGVSDGPHALQVTATLADGGTSKRRLYFEFLGSANATVSYDRDVRPISDARCAKCHATGTLPEMKNYQQWKDNAASVATAVREKRMPADGPLDPAGIQLVQRWVNGGALP